MNGWFTLRGQVVLAVLIAIASSFAIYRALTLASAAQVEIPTSTITAALTPIVIPTSTPIPSPTNTPVPQPFVTLPGVWLVTIEFYPDLPPQIQQTTPQEEGRISDLVPGENTIAILDAHGNPLFQENFFVSFIQGEPPRTVDMQKMIFFLPRVAGEASLLVKTPFGEDSYDLH